ncbi:AraC family transcriptional regulator [Paraburkholderia dipogonis]|uniref:AraC family transcriptional regulator n=1 Tax=Paraburkholderia dipogonis TaxID=1211383 RepID=UPI0038BA6BAA
MNALPALKTYGMAERASHLDFDIRDHSVRPQITQPHRHEYFQMLVALHGESMQTIGGAVRRIRPGTVTFVLPYRSHVAVMPPDAEFYVISFSLRFLRPDTHLDPLELEYVSPQAAPEIAPFLVQEHVDFVLAGADLQTLRDALAEMLRENAERRFGAALILRGHLLHVIGMVCRSHEAALTELLEARPSRNGGRDWLVRVSRLMRDRLCDDLALQDAAAAANLSQGHLAHALKRETGRTFTELLTERRMERARELLVNSTLRLSEIAHSTGFADESYFARRFRQWFGVSPGSYRRSCEQESTGKAQFRTVRRE